MSRKSPGAVEESLRSRIVTILIAQRKIGLRRQGTTIDDLVNDYMSAQITQCSLGERHAVFVDRIGGVYVSGRNTNGELGDVDRKKHVKDPMPVDFSIPSGVKQAIAGFGFSLFVSNDGEVCVCGDGARRVLGGVVGDLSKGLVKVPVPFDTPIDAVATGEEHILLLTKDGRVFGYGLNKHGELGVGGSRLGDHLHEIIIPPGVKIQALAAGDEHSVFLTAAGDVYTCGNPRFGSLGVGSEVSRSAVKPAAFRRVDVGDRKKCKAIAAAGRQTQMITTDGDVYCCGTLSKPHLPVLAPELCQRIVADRPNFVDLPPIESVAVALDNAFYIAPTGQVFVAGYREEGAVLKIGFSVAGDIALPKGVKAVSASMGADHSAIVVADDGSMFMTRSACDRLGIPAASRLTRGFSKLRVKASAFEEETAESRGYIA